MDDSTSYCQLNQSKVDFEFESNEVPGFMIVELNNVVNLACEICCSLFIFMDFYLTEGHWCLDHFEGRVASFTSLLSKSSRDAQTAQGTKHVLRRTIENNEEVGIRTSKTYQSFVAAAGCYRELNFIEKDVRNYITREVWNVSELEDAKEFGK
ncbi:hypothetical protein Ahy_A09g044951 [Arachis hypogaea]|uniref:Uncharacterized protein n=1 Tax=Arachis hypogaea TaxID=3818 RepID=A0A445BL76_ARAHY|nr:hypothetical protein Ahy_A09g044951 [Arachis hypogaea]